MFYRFLGHHQVSSSRLIIYKSLINQLIGIKFITNENHIYFLFLKLYSTCMFSSSDIIRDKPIKLHEIIMWRKNGQGYRIGIGSEKCVGRPTGLSGWNIRLGNVREMIKLTRWTQSFGNNLLKSGKRTCSSIIIFIYIYKYGEFNSARQPRLGVYPRGDDFALTGWMRKVQRSVMLLYFIGTPPRSARPNIKTRTFLAARN